ncbi:MAG: hypothetical protein VXW65_15505 [Pseudomonadota bacterium]|nr:hypothetical protein [Pseudomonadota bacterium]
MKNYIVILIVVVAGIWLLWIKSNQIQASATHTTATHTRATVTDRADPVSSDFAALTQLIRVFESNLDLSSLNAVNQQLKSELPKLSLQQRYQVYEQLQQAIAAYVSQLNHQHNALLEHYAAAHMALWQKIAEAPDSGSQGMMSQLGELFGSTGKTEAELEQRRWEALEKQQAQAFAQQWPAAMQQGLNDIERQLIQDLDRQQIDILDIGEGLFEFRLNPRYWIEPFGKMLTAADRAYFALMAEQNQEQYYYDAAIAISWEALGQRAYAWERYLATYPDSYFGKAAEQAHQEYVMHLLVGMDNTGTVYQGQLDPMVKAAYDTLRQQYPRSQLAKTLGLFEQELQAAADPDVQVVARRAMSLAKDRIEPVTAPVAPAEALPDALVEPIVDVDASVESVD